MTRRGIARFALPVLVGLLVLLGWESLVELTGIKPYVLPGPWRIARTLVAD